MPKQNAYLAKRQAQIDEAVNDGFLLGTCLCVVALNEKFGFGAKRIETLETEVQRIWNEEFQNGDMEVAAVGLKKRIEQIRGEDVWKGVE